VKKKKHIRQPLSLRFVRFAFARLGPLFPGFFGKQAYRLWFTTHRFRRPAIENSAAELADRSTLDINGVNVTVWSWGQGKPVLFMHGWSGRGTQAVHFLQPLIDCGYRVISYDSPAHGETPGRQTSMLEISDVVLALSDRYGPFHSTITHSFGGMILAYSIAPGLNTASAVCICPPASIESILHNFQQALTLPDKVMTAMTELLYANYGDDLERRVSTLKNVQTLSIPALIIHDENDLDVPWEDGKAVADAWQGAEFMRTKGLGHRRILRDPAVIAATIEFIRKS
jgi:pimeloyl-ACP methyl ester carboxylesterase